MIFQEMVLIFRTFMSLVRYHMGWNFRLERVRVNKRMYLVSKEILAMHR